MAAEQQHFVDRVLSRNVALFGGDVSSFVPEVLNVAKNWQHKMYDYLF